MRTALGRHRQALLLGIAVLVSVVLAERDAGAFHDERGGHINQVAIDMGPPGVAVDVEGNGKPAVGDRNFDGIPDAEGFDASAPLPDVPGICGNGIDDDLGVDVDGTPFPPDGVADDGCVVNLTPLEQCAEIIDDGILNADEDFLVGGQDRLSIDITVGAQPGPGGGIPVDRPIKAWFYELSWDPDVLDILRDNGNFLILAAGGSTPFLLLSDLEPDRFSPFYAEGHDSGPSESGAGVVARLTIEANAAGTASLFISGAGFLDRASQRITIDKLYPAILAVSKDVDGNTLISGPSEVFKCRGCRYAQTFCWLNACRDTAGAGENHTRWSAPETFAMEVTNSRGRRCR